MSMDSDRARIMSELTDAGVSGLEDFGRFVNDSRYLDRSRFDEIAAYPLLLRIYPSITEPKTLEIVARYIGHQRADDSAFVLLHDSFIRYAKFDQNLGWTLGDSLAKRGTRADLDQMLEICLDSSHGMARQMIVHSIWRYRSDRRVEVALKDLVKDPDVSLHAMSALRRTIGNAAALPLLLEVRDSSPDEKIRRQAQESVRKIQWVLAK